MENNSGNGSANGQQNPREITKAKPRIKPLVEGINAPRRKANGPVFAPPVLTEQENKLIAETPEASEVASDSSAVVNGKKEPKLLPNSVINRINKPSGRGSGLRAILVVVILALAAYGIYSRYFYKSSVTININSENPADQGQFAGLSNSTRHLGAINPNPEPTAALQASSTPAVATTTPAVLQKKLKITSTPTGYLNFREGPSLSNKILTRVHPEEVYTYTQQKSGWYKIVLADGRSGWVYGQYVSLVR